jgi:serine/threonine protein kinase
MLTAELVSLRFVLNPNVELTPVDQFGAEVRQRIGGDPSDVVLSERRSRATSQRVDSGTAAFLRRFGEPTRIVDAVIAHAEATGASPKRLLRDLYPVVAHHRQIGILVEESAPTPAIAGPMFADGEIVHGLKISCCVYARAETEVYHATTEGGEDVALKCIRPRSPGFVREALRRELAILKLLHSRGDVPVPRPYASDLERHDAYLALTWYSGRTAADLSRDIATTLAQRATAVQNLVAAYCRIHAAGVLHGDVHPLNTLVAADGEIRLIDFGGARLVDQDATSPRIGLVSFYEPEVARAILSNAHAPNPSEKGEQYAVAALAYLILTGSMYLGLSLETAVAARQIVEEEPRPFAEFGLSWVQVEGSIRRALQKRPEDRFPLFADFAANLTRGLAELPPTPVVLPLGAKAQRNVVDGQTAFATVVDGFLGRYGLNGDLLRRGISGGPTASVYHGAAGVAYALMRIGVLRRSPDALAAADVWITKALHDRHRPDSFEGGDVSVRDGTVGAFALFHSLTGLWVVQALVRYASGDLDECRGAVEEFIALARASLNSRQRKVARFAVDATNGAASLLLGASLLLPVCLHGSGVQAKELRLCGAALARVVQTELKVPRRQRGSRTRQFLGFAHGRAGALYSLLQWAEVAGTRPHFVQRHLFQLARSAVRQDQGKAWPLERGVSGSRPWSGWCHGSAGHILLWTQAARVCPNPLYGQLAAAAGEHIWHSRGGSGPSLCCGLAGEAMSLFDLGRLTGEDKWLTRGQSLAAEALESIGPSAASHGLFKGDLGIELVAIEAQMPLMASFPMCQSPFC